MILEWFSNILLDISVPNSITVLVTLTGSSGVTCSDGAIFKLYAAHNISFDFFNVSSILQAAKRAAAAASYIGSAVHLLDMTCLQ